ncbi:MAG: redoxin domain-containing protein [Dysgonamonadaceae bacterium]|jgi:peroxiredoxin|nr:redoxin domain-containing protein [Dysgonamonadaceae bacterium]
MKYVIYITLCVSFLFGCKKDERYVIKGTLIGLQSPTLYFVSPSPTDEVIRIDTIQSENGKFLFKGSALGLVPVTIYMENGNVWTTLWAQNKDTILVSGDANYPELIASDGNQTNNFLTDFRTKHADLLKERRDLIDKQTSPIAQTDSLDPVLSPSEYKEKLAEIDRQLQEFAEEAILQNPSSIASLVLLQDYLMDTADPQLIQEYLSKMTDEVAQSPLFQKLAEANAQILKTIPGAPAPDFVLLDAQNDTVNLDVFKGSYFLLTFSASWCGLVDKDNDDLINLRKKIKTDDLKILTIALDSDRTAWTKIVEDKKLNWSHVVDTTGWDADIISLYNITEVPSNVLIDKESIIVGRNLPSDSIIGIIEKTKKH